MLEEIIRALDGGKIHKIDDLAQVVGAPVSLVRSMIDHLLQMGYLVPVLSDCTPSACAHCHTTCVIAQSGDSDKGMVYMLSPKGKAWMRARGE